MKISKKSEKLIERFIEAAKDFGWQEDQGNADNVEKSRVQFELALHALINRIAKLEKHNE